jgi:type 1 glutamine amidotransferase
MNRREMLIQCAPAALALGTVLNRFAWAAPKDAPRKRVLMYTRSVEFEHDCVRRKKGQKLSLAENIVTELGSKHGFDVVCEKDGRVFLSNDFPKFDGFVFETQGDLTAEKCKDGSPPMPAEGKKALLKAIASGKGFVGCHCASDTFHSEGRRNRNQDRDKLDPYIAMLGGEFIKHGRQQKAWQRVADNKFPGLKGVEDFELHEEWYALKNFAADLHVILVQDTKGMVDAEYQREKFPATWARMHEKGRVFFTSMGHRDDVWKNELFQKILLGGLSWSLGLVNADIPPNLKDACPKAGELPGAK